MIYVATPYSHDDKQVEQCRFQAAAIYSAVITKLGQLAVSPVVIGHTLVQHVQMPTTFGFWNTFCLELLSKCDQMHVLQLEGWTTSVGVLTELQFARTHGIDVTFVDPVTYSELDVIEWPLIS